jgi:hypothetical protein
MHTTSCQLWSLQLQYTGHSQVHLLAERSRYLTNYIPLKTADDHQHLHTYYPG